jgi:hypothetical protein
LLAAAAVPLLAGAVLFSSSRAEDASAPDLAIDPRLADYPQLVIELNEERIEAPAAVAAGPTLLIEENPIEGPGHAFVLRVPDDVSDADLAASLGNAAPVEETPEWFWRAAFLGNGDRAAAGRPGIALVNLQPGRYVAGDPYRPASEFAVFEATGDGSSELPAIATDGEADLFEMGFNLPEQIEAGRQVWEITNTGAMLHELAIMPVPAGATQEQVETAITAELEAEFGGDPAAARATIDGLGAEWKGWRGEHGLVAGVGVLSPQGTSYAQFDFAPGTYGVVCYVPEPNSMTPHVMFGMTAVFTVEEPEV